MNSYVPKLYNRQPEPKRPATAIGSPDVGDLGSLSTVGGNKLDAPKMRRGRRGISPTVDTPTTQQGSL